MFNRKTIFFLIALVLLVLPAISSFAAYEFYMKIEGTKQGAFKGDSARDQWAGYISGYAFSNSVRSITSTATGLASGKRQYNPIRVLIHWGPATPQILQALATNEAIKSVALEFVHTTPEGVEEVYFKIMLTNAIIVGVSMDAASDTKESAWVSFNFQKIEWEHMTGKTIASDNWTK